MKKHEIGVLVIMGSHLLGEVFVKVVDVEEVDEQGRLFRSDEHPEQSVVIVLAEWVLPPELLADSVECSGVRRSVHDVANGEGSE